MNIYLIRHTKVITNPYKICYGQSNVKLKHNYIKDFRKIKNKLNNIQNKTIFTSPLTRCSKLAEYISNYKKQYKIDNRLIELNFGNWELQKWKDINQKDSNIWTKNFIKQKCPNGESYNDLFNRAKNFYSNIINSKYSNIIIITHKGIIISILSLILNIPLQNSFKINIDYSSISKIIYKKNTNIIKYINRI